jgi:hypothetical protein
MPQIPLPTPKDGETDFRLRPEINADLGASVVKEEVTDFS